MADGMARAEQWFSAADLAGLPGLPGTERNVRARAERDGWTARPRSARGGGNEYALSSLPAAAQAALVLRSSVPAPESDLPHAAPRAVWTEERREAAWQHFERAKDRLKDVAKRRLRALHAVEALRAHGVRVMEARAQVVAQLQRENVRGASMASLSRWAGDVAAIPRNDWLAVLLPSHVGRTKTAEIEPAAWALFKADYLRLEAPSATSCHRRLKRIATQRPEWAPLPAVRTFERRIEREIPRPVLVLAREGEDALMRTFPAQERDRTVFGALEGVNADGHVWDVGVTFPDGTTGRPVIVGWQDLASGKILAWRLGPTESSDLVRLAFCDLVTRYGIPGAAWLDNGRSFASKYLTGGTPNRYRFKVREEDPAGIIVALGTKVHWVTPYHGQAKPIERAWRDFCTDIAKHPAFAGAYLGNSVANKPENYGSRTVPWDEFARVVDEEIAAHNARLGRRSKVCNGRSFDQVFGELYGRTTIRKASAEQLRTLLLASEAVTANAESGSVVLAGNRYWNEALSHHAGRKLVVRFDPMALHGSVHVYALDGAYICEAECIASVGFADTNASREHARAKKLHRRATKQRLEAERRMDAATVASQLPSHPRPELPAATVIAAVFGSTTRTTTPSAESDIHRTGTDDDRGAVLDAFLQRVQAKQNAERL